MMRSSYGVGHLTDRIEVTITVNHSLVGFRKAQWDEKVHDGAEGATGVNSPCVHDIGWLQWPVSSLTDSRVCGCLEEP